MIINKKTMKITTKPKYAFKNLVPRQEQEDGYQRQAQRENFGDGGLLVGVIEGIKIGIRSCPTMNEVLNRQRCKMLVFFSNNH